MPLLSRTLTRARLQSAVSDAHPWAWPVSKRPLLPGAQLHYCHRAREILDSLRLSLPTVAPGQTPGALRFVSPALHILRIRAKGTAGAFQRGKFPNSTSTRKRVCSYSITAISRAQPRNTGSTQQAWMNSRNQSTIATRSKHRQHVFLHPMVMDSERKLWPRLSLIERRNRERSSAENAQDFGRGLALAKHAR